MQKKGFTLIELLVVIAIIGLLATLSVISFSNSSAKARDTKRKQDLRSIQKALELYYNDNEAYPSTGGTWRGTGGCYGTWATTGTNAYVPGLAPRYIGIIPTDPRPLVKGYWPCSLANQSCYLYNSNGTDYKLISHCGIEGPPPSADEPFYDPVRAAYGMMVCSANATVCNTW
jgi:prepilin-type N-terminal cleavage/methylation domain-containing protein